jgi:hypothetical protein
MRNHLRRERGSGERKRNRKNIQLIGERHDPGGKNGGCVRRLPGFSRLPVRESRNGKQSNKKQ